MSAQRCHDCGRAWPHPLLYDVRRDGTADTIGRCPWCSWFTAHQQLRLPWEAA